jgi:hypothetical protein
MADLSEHARKVLGATPEEFVAERDRIARELKQTGRDEDARAIAALRKPSAVVLAVNRAARDRPQAARDAANSAEEVAKAQLSGDAAEYAKARKDLDGALALLAEVAVAQLSRSKPATESMRRRVAELLRSAIADPDARAALGRGVLEEEGGAAGFSAFAAMAPPAAKRRAKPESGRTKAAEKRKQAKRERKQQLEAELAQAEEALEAAERALATASRERDKAARSAAAAAKRLERLKDS